MAVIIRTAVRNRVQYLSRLVTELDARLASIPDSEDKTVAMDALVVFSASLMALHESNPDASEETAIVLDKIEEFVLVTLQFFNLQPEDTL